MSLEGRAAALRARHSDLDQKLQDEVHRPRPDDDILHRLKTDKLHLKEEIERISGHN